MWRHMRVSADKLHHQNEKPVPLLEQAVLSMSDPGDTVLDPFMGSGSTGVACLNCGRDFVGCEIDPGYFDVARDRLDAESAQGRMFAGLW
nr:site-specific DNA-methyltransferase [uncultured Adlercreutzia sp.]